ncbi:MAG: YggU family protein [Phycisphaeraceae bacterium]|nr:YggU family protein [Phycisphaeraceae bacterium]
MAGILEASENGILLHVKVVPGASRSSVAGVLGDRLKLRVAAPPEDGKANAAVVDLLSAVLGVPARDIELIAGHSRPQKTLRITGLNVAMLRDRLGLL